MSGVPTKGRGELGKERAQYGDTTVVEQSSPMYPSSHTHTPLEVSQSPFPEQSEGHIWNWHPFPKYSESQTQTP